jgi:hypothetical protein
LLEYDSQEAAAALYKRANTIENRRTEGNEVQSKSLANPFYSNKFRVNDKSESPPERNLGTPPRKDWKKSSDDTVPAFGGYGQADNRCIEDSKQKQSNSLSPTRVNEYI